MNPLIVVSSSTSDLCSKAAEKIIEIGTIAIAERGRFTLVLSGGKTPKDLYEVIAKNFSKQLDWSKVHFFWGDERDVVWTHPDSNFGMAKAALLDPIAAPAGNLHRIGTEEDAMLAAQQTEDDIRDFFGLQDGGFPKFDLILLGLGDDGHTASLFPDTDAIKETRRLVVDNFVKKLKTHRVTFTFPVLNHAANVLFLVSGPGKAAIVKHVLQGSSQELLPSQMVRPAGNLYWFLDKDAASQLS